MNFKSLLLSKLLIIFITFNAYAIEFSSKADYAILIDDNTNTILYEKNADIPTPPSSMSKLMTVYIIFDHIKNGIVDINEKFKASRKAWRMQGSKTFVSEGQLVSVDDLLKGIIIQSGNDASIVAAEGISGSESSFVLEMATYADKLGLKNSDFRNATGWPDKDHVMSTKDLAILAHRLIHDFPEYYSYFAERDFSFNGIRQPNRNVLLGRGLGVDGLKTGHTDLAGYGIVVSAKRNDRRLIVVVNGLSSEAERAAEVERLLLYGFKNFVNKDLFKQDEIIEHADVWFGSKVRLPLTTKDDISITMPKNIEKDKFKLFVRYNGPLAAPINKGDQVAELVIQYYDKEKKYPLFAAEDITKLTGLRHILRSIHYYLS